MSGRFGEVQFHVPLKLIVGLSLFIVCAVNFSASFTYGRQTQFDKNGFLTGDGPALLSAELGQIFAIHQVGDILLISTEKGLYRWNADLSGKPEVAAVSTTSQFGFYQAGDALLIGADGGLYRWNDRLEGRPEPVDRSIELARSFYQLSGTLLIGASSGLYRWNERLEGKPELVDARIANANRFSVLGDTLVFTGSGGLYRWNVQLEGRPEPLPITEDVRVLHQAGSILLLGTAEGLYRWNDKLEGSPEDVGAGMGVIIAFHQAVGAVLISAENGLYRWDGRLEGKPTLVSRELNFVLASLQLGDTLLLGADEGVYRWNIQLTGEPTLISTEVGGVTHFQRVGSALLVNTVSGLYRWNDGLVGRPELVSEDTGIGALYFSHQRGSTLLIAAARGLYQWNDKLEGNLRPLMSAMSDVRSFQDIEGGLLLGTDVGLFRWNERLEGEPQLVDASFRSVNAFCKVGGALLIGAEGGLFQWNDRLEGQPTVDTDLGRVSTIYQVGGTILISTDRGLYRWGDKLTGNPVAFDTAVGGISAFHKVGDTLLVGAAGGLYRWNEGLEGRPDLSDAEVGRVHALRQTGDILLIGTQRGLFKVGGVGIKWDADIAVQPLSGQILSDAGLTVKWTIRNFEQRANPRNVRIRLIVKDSNGAVVNKDAGGDSIKPEQWLVPAGQQQLTIPALPPGAYSLTVQATDLTGNTAESAPVNFKVYSSLEEVVLDWGRYLTFLYAFLTLLLFLTLVICARRSRRCFDLLTDPVVRKFGIYFGFALRHVRPVRLWVFERYFDELKKDWSGANVYVPYHLIPPGNSPDRQRTAPIESTDIIKRLRDETHILILGGPGTGKSALVGNLMNTYCREASLRAAWSKYGFIPVVVRLRELAGSQGVKVTELARSALDGKGMTFGREDSFFESLLRNGDFLLILDGLNEVDVGAAVNEFIVIQPSVRLLTTSQTDSLSAAFSRYILPFFDSRFAQALLRKFVGDGPAEKAIESAPELWGDIKCGYDVRLVEHLIRSATAYGRHPSVAGGDNSSLPKNRLELYRAMVQFSKERYEQAAIQMKAFPYVRICERAWNMWRIGQYQFQPDESLTQVDVEHLVKTNLALKRPQGYEFMHSLMRDFLSAEFCMRHSGPTKLMIQTRLQGEDADMIWKLPPDDQATVFSFMAESIEGIEDLEEIFQFASQKIKERHQLLIAVQEIAKKRGWQIKININAE